MVYGGKVKIHFSGKLRHEISHFQVNNHVAMQFDVIEKQIEIVVLLTYDDMYLTADEGETRAEFQEEITEVREKTTLQIPLDSLIMQGEKIEIVGGFEQFLREFGLRRGESAFKVGRRVALPLMQATFDLMYQNVTAPALFDSLVSIPRADFRVLNFSSKTALCPQRICATACGTNSASIG